MIGAPAGVLPWLSRLAAHASQGVHVLCFPRSGHHDLTLSARVYLESEVRPTPRWCRARRWLDGTFAALPWFGHREHCARSWAADVAQAQWVLRQRQALERPTVRRGPCGRD